MWHMVGSENSLKISSLFLTVWDGQCLEDSKQKDDFINEWTNYEGVYRTARATPKQQNYLHWNSLTKCQ